MVVVSSLADSLAASFIFALEKKHNINNNNKTEFQNKNNRILM